MYEKCVKDAGKVVKASARALTACELTNAGVRRALVPEGPSGSGGADWADEHFL